MKKLLFAAMLLASCGYESQNNLKPNIVVQTGMSAYANLCYYECIGSEFAGFGEILASKSFTFYDSCGKYRVGDTVKIVKY